MATWRVARSLDTLLGQLNAMAPKRSKLSDGSIGDAAHASRDSDHNPWIKSGGLGIVTARDFTNDPNGGLDCNWLAAALVRSGDPRIKYVIWNRRIWTGKSGWVAYKGINPHDHHLHLSVSEQPGWFDSTLPWSFVAAASGGTSSPITILPVDPPAQEDDMYDGAARNELIGRIDQGFAEMRNYFNGLDNGDTRTRIGVIQYGMNLLLAKTSDSAIDYTRLADALAPVLAPMVADAGSGATADEIADKLAQRLAG